MHKADFAEAILSLTTTTERAAATAGDLAEDADARGTLWFWSSLIKTTASLVWREFVGQPRRIANSAFVAFMLQLAFLAAITFLIGVASIIVVASSLRTRPITADAPGIMVAAALGLFTCQFFVGKWLARYAAGRALPACIAYVVASKVVWMLVSPWIPGPHHPFGPLEASLLTLLEWTALFAGIYRGARGSKNLPSSIPG